PADRLERAARSVLDLPLLSGTRSGRPPRSVVPAVPSERSAMRALALAAAAIALQPVVGAPQPNFSTRREAVRVDVLVTDRGQPIAGLGPADFDLLDNGVAQHVDLVSYEQIPLNVVLAFDTSDSVTGDRLEHLHAAGEAVLSGLKTGDQA